MAKNMHELICRYSLPVKRGRLSVCIFLEQYYREFIDDLKELVAMGCPNDLPPTFYDSLVTKHLSVIETECEMILDILLFDEKNQQLAKREKFDALMRVLKENGALRCLSIGEDSFMSRIRQGKGPFARKDLFHIPFSKRHLSSSQRFSIPGNPCLYLSVFPGLRLAQAEMFELCWMESGMPKEFYACFYKTQRELKFLHFAKKGDEYLKEYNKATSDADKSDRMEALYQYLLTFPMRAACFVSIEDKQSKKDFKYYEEYVFPQLLMEWIQNNRGFDGLAYQSASSIEETHRFTAYNVAMPVRDVDPNDGYDIELKKALKLSTPQMMDLVEAVKHIEKDMLAIVEYAKELDNKLALSSASKRHPYYLLLSLCRSVSLIYFEMKDGNENNMSIPFQQLCALCRIAVYINKSIEHAKSADEWIEIYRLFYKDSVLANNDYEDILKQFSVVNLAIQKLKGVFYMNRLSNAVFSEPEFAYIDE